jgi:small-conductance mechanosensitive channel
MEIPQLDKIVKSCVWGIILYSFSIGISKIINRRIKDLKKRYKYRKNIYYLTTLLFLLILSGIWLENLRTIVTVLSIIGAGVVVALREVIVNIVGWMFIVIRRPFEIGDRIEVRGVKGDIIDIGLFRVSMLEVKDWQDGEQSTGRIVGVPNLFVFKEAVFNYTKGFEFLWDEVIVVITFESNWRKAREIILKHLKEITKGVEEKVKIKLQYMAKRYVIYYKKLTPIVYVSIEDNGIGLVGRYLVEVHKRRMVRNKISESLLNEFEKEKEIEFAYPTYRIYKREDFHSSF